MTNEKTLLAAARRGDEGAIRKLIDSYSPRLYNVALRILRNSQDAEDALQETFVTALNKLDQFDGRSAFLTWIYRIAVNSSLMALRKRRSRSKREESIEVPGFEEIKSRQLIDWNADPSRRVMTNEMREVMDKAIDQLPPNYRTVFVLRDLEELSTEEAAKILGISVANVKVRLMRARLFLREALDAYFYESKEAEGRS
jgi:RNA polymerase sigma-70 factor (ECF subfamily)